MAFCLSFIASTAYSAGGRDAAVQPHYKKHYSMGTVFEIVAYDAPSVPIEDAMRKAFEEIDRLDREMSNYKPDSELSRLNSTAHFRAESVSKDLYQVVQQSLRYSELSGGAFDISVGPLANRWKAVGQGEPAPLPSEVEKLRRCVGYRMIHLVPPNKIEFHSACMELDLGAIGKGYAVDQAVAVLRSNGVERALLNAGGSSIYAMGSPPGMPGWTVHLRDPSGRLTPRILLRDNSVSTSEQTAPSLLGKVSFGHIINPATGWPVKSTFAVSAVAETATASDGLSTTLFLLGPSNGKDLVEKLPNVAAIWISPEGQFERVSTGPSIAISPTSER